MMTSCLPGRAAGLKDRLGQGRIKGCNRRQLERFDGQVRIHAGSGRDRIAETSIHITVLALEFQNCASNRIESDSAFDNLADEPFKIPFGIEHNYCFGLIKQPKAFVSDTEMDLASRIALTASAT